MALKEYEVELADGTQTTMLIDDKDLKTVAARVVGKPIDRSIVSIDPVDETSDDETVEVAADVERPAVRKARGTSKETR